MRNKNKLIFFICWITYASIYLLRLNLSVAGAELSSTGILTGKEISYMGSLFFVSYAIGQLINGYLGDRYNPKVLIVTGMVVSSATNIIIGLLLINGHSGIWLYLYWAVNGYSQSMLWGPIMRIVSSIYEDKKLSNASAILSISYATGSIMAYVVTTFIVNLSEVWAAFIAPALLILIIAIFAAVFLPKIASPNKPKGFINPFKMLKNRLILLNIIPVLTHGLIKDNLMLWMPLLIVTLFKIELQQSLLLIIITPLMFLLGKLLFPFLFKLCRKKVFLLNTVCFGFCVIFLSPLLIPDIPPYITVVLLGLITALISMVNTSMLSMFPLYFKQSNDVSKVSGLMDFITYIGAAIGAILFGHIALDSFSAVVVVWIVCAALALVVSTLISKNNLLNNAQVNS